MLPGNKVSPANNGWSSIHRGPSFDDGYSWKWAGRDERWSPDPRVDQDQPFDALEQYAKALNDSQGNTLSPFGTRASHGRPLETDSAISLEEDPILIRGWTPPVCRFMLTAAQGLTSVDTV